MSRFPDPRDWKVTRYNHDLRRVRIVHFEEGSPAAWIARLRSNLPALQKRTPSDLLGEVRKTGAVDLGTMRGREAVTVTGMLKSLGFDVHVEDASYISHFSSVAGYGLIMEDEDEAEAFCLKLLQGGAQLRIVEVD